MFNERIKKLRQEMKLSQYELAEKLGFSRGQLANYEQGKREPDYATLQKLADFFEVSADYLLGRTDKPRHEETAANNKNDKEFNALEEIKKLCDEYGIEDFGFFDISKWREMTPDDVEEIRKHFEYIMFQVNKRKDEEK